MSAKKEDGLNWWFDLVLGRFNWLNLNAHQILKGRRRTEAEKRANEELRNHYAKLGGITASAAGTACDLRCGSICCFFPCDGGTVHIELSLVDKITGRLRSMGMDPNGYVRQRRWSELPERLQAEIPQERYIREVDGVRVSYEVENKGQTLPEHLAYNIPRTWQGLPLWTCKGSRACSFLNDDKRCSVQLWGIKPKYCSDFVCSTCIITNVVRHMGYLTEGAIRGLSFPEVNSLADRLLLVINSSGFKNLEMDYNKALLELGYAYVQGLEVEKPLFEFRSFEAGYYPRRKRMFEGAISPGFLDYLRQLLS